MRTRKTCENCGHNTDSVHCDLPEGLVCSTTPSRWTPEWEGYPDSPEEPEQLLARVERLERIACCLEDSVFGSGGVPRDIGVSLCHSIREERIAAEPQLQDDTPCPEPAKPEPMTPTLILPVVVDANGTSYHHVFCFDCKHRSGKTVTAYPCKDCLVYCWGGNSLYFDPIEREVEE